MDYVDWVGRVLDAMSRAWSGADQTTRDLTGVHFMQIGVMLGFNHSEFQTFALGRPIEAVTDALRDLHELHIIEPSNSIQSYASNRPQSYIWTQRGREIQQVGIST